jgi:glycosyltransferase involved in cell wall biosynthesis
MIEVAIFSYNRGSYLVNCYNSVKRNLPNSSIYIYDDGSDDPATQLVLKQLNVDVINCRVQNIGRLGGLYSNMQLALENAKEPYLLLLQDDTQVVRPINFLELENVSKIFRQDIDAAFVSPIFLKGSRRRSRSRLLVCRASDRTYSFNSSSSRRIVDRFYNDISICNVEKLKSSNWVFKESEKLNAKQSEIFGFSPLTILADPFVFFCPEVPVFRNHYQTFATRWANKIIGQEVCNFVDMSEDQVRQFLMRDPCILPFAEDFLIPNRLSVRRPFVYKSVNARWYTRALNKLELIYRKIIS